MDRVSPLSYRFVVQGELGPLYASAFEGMQIEFESGRSTIVGPVEDQAQLQGMLARIANLGLVLISVAPVEP